MIGILFILIASVMGKYPTMPQTGGIQQNQE